VPPSGPSRSHRGNPRIPPGPAPGAGAFRAERRRRIDGDGATRFSRLLLALPIAVDPVTRGTALTETRRLARTHGLTSYAAAYLELAIRLGVPLATLDEKLSAAARNEGVTLALDEA
jgi:predicted nucleic acid-binding protein